MPDQQPFAGRIEQKIDSLQGKIDTLSEKVITLTAVNEAHQSLSQTNAKDIEAIKKDVNFAKGAVAVCLILLGFVGAAIGWAFSSISGLQQKANDINTQVSIGASKQTRIDTDLNSMNQRVSAVERNSPR